jgi:hypothetical protein
MATFKTKLFRYPGPGGWTFDESRAAIGNGVEEDGDPRQRAVDVDLDGNDDDDDRDQGDALAARAQP